MSPKPTWLCVRPVPRTLQSRSCNSSWNTSVSRSYTRLATAQVSNQSSVARRCTCSLSNTARIPTILSFSKKLTGETLTSISQIRLYSQDQSSRDREDARFSYKIAASYVGKGHPFDPQTHHESYDSQTGRHRLAGMPVEGIESKKGKRPSGQDACFISAVGETDGAAFAVADGVGGWIDQGIDSAEFAHGICNAMAETAEHFPLGFNEGDTTIAPRDLLERGYQMVCEDESIAGGGSTVCLGIVDVHGTLGVANLGDSGFMQLRLNKVHYYSDPQTHAFNTPYQLSLIPPKVLAQIATFGGGSPLSDLPKDASVTHHELNHGDVLVFGTDGIWDNLTSQDVLQVVSEKMKAAFAWVDGEHGTQIGESLLPMLDEEEATGSRPTVQTAIATGIVKKAKLASIDPKRDGPFAKAVQRKFPSERFNGGKADDIAVVVAIAVDEHIVL